jgi:hypothetical protein
LAHAPGQFARIGGLEPVQADEVDRRQRSFADVRPRHALRFETQSDVFEHRQPRKQREALEHHGYTYGGAGNRLTHIAQVAGGRFRQPGDQAEQCRLSRTGSPQQSHDLAFAQLKIHTLEHQELRPVRLGEGLAHFIALQ